MNCDRAQELLSARMDGEHLVAVQRSRLEDHVEACADCTAFAERVGRVRTAVRIRPAEPVPDLTDAIMRGVATIPARTLRRPSTRQRRRPPTRMLPLVAAALAGALVGSVVVGGPWVRTPLAPASASEVATRVRAAAAAVDAFDGTYAIHEQGLSPAVPARDLAMRVAFLAPQRFRLDVTDETAYPSAAWTPTDLTYIENLDATYRSGPTGCPRDLPAGACPPTRTTLTRTSGYSAAAPLPIDLIAPVMTFDSARGIDVLGSEDVNGHRTIRAAMSFARAAPLFPFLRLGGTWRPFFEEDRVVAWFDTDGWYPVREQVFPSTDPARRDWESRFGLPHESPDEPILDVTLTSVASQAPDPSLFAVPGVPTPPSIPLGEAASVLGYAPATPSAPTRLELVAVVPSGGADGSVLVYSAGLEYLRIGEDRGWSGPGAFGPISASARSVRLADGGVATFEPAADGFGRRIGIHTSGADLYLESNLPREELLTIASSLPGTGVPLPPGGRA